MAHKYLHNGKIQQPKIIESSSPCSSFQDQKNCRAPAASPTPVWAYGSSARKELSKPHSIPISPLWLKRLAELCASLTQQLPGSCHVLGGRLGALLDEFRVLLDDALDGVGGGVQHCQGALPHALVCVQGLTSLLHNGLQIRQFPGQDMERSISEQTTRERLGMQYTFVERKQGGRNFGRGCGPYNNGGLQ